MVNNVIPVSATCLLMEIALVLQRSYNYTNIGAERFELPTLWSQTKCATRLRYAPTSLLRVSTTQAKCKIHLFTLEKI